MPAVSRVSGPSNYVARFFATLWASLAQLVRSPSHSRRAEAARRAASARRECEGDRTSCASDAHSVAKKRAT